MGNRRSRNLDGYQRRVPPLSTDRPLSYTLASTGDALRVLDVHASSSTAIFRYDSLTHHSIVFIHLV